MNTCRACGSDALAHVIDLGRVPLVNRLWTTERGVGDESTRYPLAVVRCRTCGLVALRDTVAPTKLFSDYSYFSSYSSTMLAHARALAARTIDRWALGPRSRVIEIASNDGYLLRNYRSAGIPVLGIEPAANVAAVAERDHGVPTLRAFFGEALGEELAACGQLADIVHANNVVAHVPDVVGFFSGLHAVLAPAGVAILETPHLVSMLQSAQFDTIYHEHVFYWSLTAMAAVAERVGLAIVEVERVDVHGGSLRVTLARAGERSVSSSVAAVLAEEEAAGIFDDATYRRFATRSGQVARELRAAVRVLRATKRRVAAYGASAKGAVMLHAAGLGRSHLRYVVDKSPHKIGRFVPGAGVPIVSPEVLRASPPDDLLLLVWNLRDEVVAENAWFLAQGGRILVPGANGGRLEIITSDKPHPGWERVA